MTKNERTVYVFALRYALPRHTYALSIVSREILSRLNDFEDWELDGMIRELMIKDKLPEQDNYRGVTNGESTKRAR